VAKNAALNRPLGQIEALEQWVALVDRLDQQGLRLACVQTVTCPAGQTQPMILGELARFEPEICNACELKSNECK
jgi:hypothetical protein